ncbi:hypothetical protein D3C78_987670 [compost metagenome]
MALAVDDLHLHAVHGTARRIHLAAELVLHAVILGIEHGAAGGQLGHAVTLKKAGRREGLAGTIKQRRGNRRGAVNNMADVRKLKSSGVRIGLTGVQHHLDHGRRQHQVGDPFFDNGGQRCFASECRQNDVRATADHQTVQGRKISEMEHRHGMHEH